MEDYFKFLIYIFSLCAAVYIPVGIVSVFDSIPSNGTCIVKMKGMTQEGTYKISNNVLIVTVN